MYTARFLYTLISLLAALLIAAGAAVLHWATFGRPDDLEGIGIALGLGLILVGAASIVAVGQRLEGQSLRVDGIVIGLIGMILAIVGRIASGGTTSTSGTLVAALLLTAAAYLISLGAKRYWPSILVAALTIPFLRYGEYAPLMAMPVAGWIAGTTVALTTREVRRMPIVRVGLAMVGVAAALLLAVAPASAQSVFSSEWVALFATLMWLAGWAFTGFAVVERWPALPLMIATACILVGPVLEGPVPLAEGWQATLLGLVVAALVVPGMTAGTYLVGAFFGGRTVLPREQAGLAHAMPPQP